MHKNQPQLIHMKNSKVFLHLLFIFLLVFFSQCKKDEAPLCEITQPSSGAEIMQGDIVTVSVNAEDSDGSITEVIFSIDGSEVGVVTSPPYNVEWKTASIDAGNHTISVVAKDDNGNLGEDEVDVVIIKLDGEPVVNTQVVSDITTDSATLNGEVTNNGGLAVTERGFCWNIKPDPNVDDNKIESGTGTGIYSETLSGLDNGTTYYVKAYALNTKGIAYGEEKTFTTVTNLASIITGDVSNVTSTEATLNGEITQQGATAIIDRGFIYSTNMNPETDGTKVQSGTGIGAFSETINGLRSGKTYYVKAYAVNSAGTAYGEEKTFTTEAGLATVITNLATNINLKEATLRGQILNDGGATITQRGFYWSKTNSTPSSDDNVEIVSGKIGLFTATLTRLDENTQYYYVAFATNSQGTVTGKTITFTTSNSNSNEIEEGEFTDSRDGHKYKTVKIGDQIWMAENLAYLPSVRPSSEESHTDPYYYVYDYQGSNLSVAITTDNYKKYGALYNWTAATNACPSGWHLPTDEEWKKLEVQIGMSENAANDDGWRGTNEGSMLKATTGWSDDGNGTDEVSFSFLPGGIRNYAGGFGDMSNSGSWWTATEINSSYAWSRSLINNNTGVNRSNSLKENGFSVRCVKD